jgi:hypothetical protein
MPSDATGNIPGLELMKRRTISLGLLLVVFLVTSIPLHAADPRKEFDVQLNRVISKLNREAAAHPDNPVLLADLVRQEFGTAEAELKWAVDHSVQWGDIVVLAYVQATTGRSFATMTLKEDARRDFWSYVEKAGMTPTKMAHTLDGFLKLAEKERNSRIFEQLRSSRRVQAMPDLGSGFGLFQEALDFRRIDSPRAAKIHTAPGGLAKGGQ